MASHPNLCEVLSQQLSVCPCDLLPAARQARQIVALPRNARALPRDTHFLPCWTSGARTRSYITMLYVCARQRPLNVTPTLADIWNMRTWGWATVPHWTETDKRRYLDDRLCPACRRRNVQTLETACERCNVRCTVTKRRGRPPGIKETKPRRRTSAFGSEDVKNQLSPGFHNAQFLPNMHMVGFPDMSSMMGGVNADGTPVSGAQGSGSGGQGGLNAQQQQQLMLSSQLLQQQLQVFIRAHTQYIQASHTLTVYTALLLLNKHSSPLTTYTQLTSYYMHTAPSLAIYTQLSHLLLCLPLHVSF